MAEQVTFQTLFQFLQTVGILVGVYYYISRAQDGFEYLANVMKDVDEKKQRAI